MGEKLASGNELHEHVQVSWILSKAIEVNLGYKWYTTKGWEIVLRILY